MTISVSKETSMRIFAHMVVKNEAERFLDASLSWNKQWFDEVHIYDDMSTDDTLKIACKHTNKIGKHDPSQVDFMEHEGVFRQTAWDNFAEVCQPDEGDWVFCLDADEFLIGTDKDPNPLVGLGFLAGYAEGVKKEGVSISRPEIWHLDGEYPLVRLDGEWAKDRPARFVRWKPEGKIRNVQLGCGSVPLYGLKGSVQNIHMCSLLHFGYAVEGEAQRKFDLYSSVERNHHNAKHVASIVEKPKLGEWKGPMPKWWRGVK